LRERNSECVSLFDGTGLYGTIISAVCIRSLQKNICIKERKKKTMSNTSNNFITVSIQHYAGFSIKFISF